MSKPYGLCYWFNGLTVFVESPDKRSFSFILYKSTEKYIYPENKNKQNDIDKVVC